MKLDHVAIATADHRSVLASLTAELGALVLSGGVPPGAGFRAMQLRLGRGEDGMTVEVLEPYGTEDNDFLARFVESTGGGGVHHVTFKTDDVRAERQRLQRLGIEPIGVDFSGGWQEMFIHPRDAHGTLIQIAQSDFVAPTMTDWLASLPAGVVVFRGERWWDEASVMTPENVGTLQTVVVATPDLEAGVAFYRDVLGGDVEGLTMTWPGGSIRLEEASGSPRVDRLEIRGHVSITFGNVRFVEAAT